MKDFINKVNQITPDIQMMEYWINDNVAKYSHLTSFVFDRYAHKLKVERESIVAFIKENELYEDFVNFVRTIPRGSYSISTGNYDGAVITKESLDEAIDKAFPYIPNKYYKPLTKEMLENTSKYIENYFIDEENQRKEEASKNFGGL